MSRGVLFRSDSLHLLGDNGRQALSALGIGTVIDLRDAHEVHGRPDDLDGLKIRRLNLPVFEDGGVALHRRSPSLVILYRSVVTEHARVLVDVLREIARSDGTGVLVHCGTGKDRTGIVVALAPVAVGAERASVVRTTRARGTTSAANGWRRRWRTRSSTMEQRTLPDSARCSAGAQPRSSRLRSIS